MHRLFHGVSCVYGLFVFWFAVWQLAQAGVEGAARQFCSCQTILVSPFLYLILGVVVFYCV